MNNILESATGILITFLETLELDPLNMQNYAEFEQLAKLSAGLAMTLNEEINKPAE